MNLHINPNTELPVYRQIQRQIAMAIADRALQPGEPLEPEQELAARLVVSPAAVRKAYEELASAGLCDGTVGHTYLVIDPGLGSMYGRSTDLDLSPLKRELLTHELQTAREYQQRLLPPAEIAGDTWTLSSRTYPAGALAGDFYDVIQRADGIIDLIIGDVAGKGLAAGLIMAATKSLLPLAAAEASPAAALESLNRRLIGQFSNREFVALTYGRFDPQNGTLRLANAGLPDPVLLHRSGGVEFLEVEGNRLPLGIREGSRYSTSRYSIEPDDRLLLFTDGIPEAVDPQGRTLGYEDLGELLLDLAQWPDSEPTATSPRWLDRFLDQVSRRTGSILEDDWTAMLLEYHPNSKELPCSS